jgi:hypothetical protein
MNSLFWIIVAADTVLFSFMLFGLVQGGSNDGGREMGIFFHVLLPSIVLLLSVLLHVFSRALFWRALALFVVAVPGLLFLGNQVRNVYIDYVVAQIELGRGYFDDRVLKEMGAAVVACDGATLQRLAPSIDINTPGEGGISLLGLAVLRAFEKPECPTGSRLAVVQQLVALGANADSGVDGALKMKDSAFLATLLDAGANPNQLTQFDQPIIFRWLDAMPIENMRLLIDHGLDVNVKSYGNTLAFELAVKRRWDLLALLIEHGIDWRRPRDDGRTVAGDISSQIIELKTSGTVPSDLLRVQQLIDGQPQPAASL